MNVMYSCLIFCKIMHICIIGKQPSSPHYRQFLPILIGPQLGDYGLSKPYLPRGGYLKVHVRP